MRAALVFAVFALAMACKAEKDPPASKPATGSGSAGSATTAARPGVPLDQARLDAISKIKLPFPEQGVEMLDASVVNVRVVSAEPKRIGRVAASRCVDCKKLDLAEWKARSEELKIGLPGPVRAQPSTVFEVGELRIGSDDVIYTYWAGVAKTEDEHINSHALALYWNDGVNQLRVVVQDGNIPTALTVEQLVQIVPRAELEAAAKQLFASVRPSL
ncbi:MAG: hypothetical protein KBG28_28480 [Kofleriaceae bacterium]|jgi:hypothetical protein|nr:hypothetical protein [Kofleriaceae bacterium]MBP6837427.1 hypothetical protein [Kofleriaceae bacterium]MBP9207936.1 hypothetical protein [Kofleriaceae bacterium]